MRGEHVTGQVRLGAVVTLGMIFGTLGQFVVGALSPFIIPALSLSRSELGLFVTVAYAVSTVLAVPSGRVIDRADNRVVMTIVFVVSAGALLGVAASRSLVVFLACAVPVGFVQAACNPVTNRIVALHTPLRHRGVVLGAKQAGVHIGGFLAGLVLPTLAVRAGWRTAVVAAAATGAVALWASLRVVPPGSGVTGSGVSGDVPPFRWTDGGVHYMTLYAFLMGGGVAAVTVYLPLYAHEALGMAEATAGSVLATFAFTGVAARLLWGWVGDRAGRVSAVLSALAIGAVAATVVLWQAESGGAWSAWIAAVGLGLSAAAWNAVGMVAVVRESHRAHVGRATGLVTLGFFAGFIVSPTAFGALVDATGSYSTGWLAIAAHFGLAGAVTALWRARDPVDSRRRAPGPAAG